MASLNQFLEKALDGEGVSRGQALVLADNGIDIYDLMHAANRVRERFFGSKVLFCSIINAKSGRCLNDCAFCAQSSHYDTGVEETGLVDSEDAVTASRNAARSGAVNFGLVMSGVGPEAGDTRRIAEAVRTIHDEGNIQPCASLGEIDGEKARLLYDAGLRRYHHNLETSERFYPNICSTYDYRKKVDTLRAATRAGLEICCGGIFGLGETWEDRVDMAMTIRGLGASSVPINFLRPVEGTPLGSRPVLGPLKALRIISVYRFIFPTTTIKVCGGREYVLRDLQSWMFHAGANGAMLGNYLTTAGREVDEDLQMVRDLGLELDNGKGPAA